jgi:hypothetical protein
MLPVFKDFARVRGRTRAMVRNASMRGVGTKVGTVLTLDLLGKSAAHEASLSMNEVSK